MHDITELYFKDGTFNEDKAIAMIKKIAADISFGKQKPFKAELDVNASSNRSKFYYTKIEV